MLLRAPIPQLVVLAIVLGGLYALATSPVFSITRVEALGMPQLQGLVEKDCSCLNHNIFLARPDAIHHRLSASIPWVDVRQVYGRLPNRIVVDAAYRQPVALWRTKVATYTVDMTGTVLYDVKTPPVPSSMVPTTATVPLIYSPWDTTFPSGGHVAPVAVQMVLATQRGLTPDIARTVHVFHWSPYSGLAVHSSLGWWAFLGIFLHSDLQARLDDLNAPALQGVIKAKGCNYIDLQVIPNAYCRNEPNWSGPTGPG